MATPDFYGMLSQIGDTFQENRVRGNRERTLAELGEGRIDLPRATHSLLASGDREGAMILSNLGRDQRDFTFRQDESKRAQANADRLFALQKQQAEEAARGNDYREVDDGQGGKTLIRINKATGATEKVPITGAQTEPNNPFAYGKQNETQSKDSGYANRMFRAEGVLRDPKVEGAAVNLWENAKGMLPGFAANYATSPEFQKFDQAKRDFVNAVLRRESGAAISASEFENATKQYFPQPGDSAEKIAEKKRNRQDAIAGVAGGGGQTYKPPFTFDPTGNMVPTTNQRQGVKPALPKVNSPAEAAKLPKGTRFIDPNGVERVVP